MFVSWIVSLSKAPEIETSRNMYPLLDSHVELPRLSASWSICSSPTYDLENQQLKPIFFLNQLTSTFLSNGMIGDAAELPATLTWFAQQLIWTTAES